MDLNGENHHESMNEILLRQINEILMGEDETEQQMLQEWSEEFREKERTFYEALGQEYPNDDDDHGESSDAVPPIQEFNDDDVWVCRVDGRDEKLEACIADLTVSMNNIIMHQPNKKKKNKRKKDLEVAPDLRDLLFSCAKSVTEGNHCAANEFLEQIRQHSSPSGNEIQRLAYYFAEGLESRLAVANSYCQTPRISNPPDYLKTLFVARASASFLKISSFITNKMIMIEYEKKAAATTTTVIHIIDFGILYGFQRPSFIKCVADHNQREGGPLKLRITGIDFPLEARIIEDTGRRLSCYAETLGVPFEYKAIAQEWEKIKIEDLKIEKGELVAVFCSTRSLKLMDDVVGVEKCPRDMFLKLVRKISPDIFLHETVNAGYNNPSFLGRFRELWYHYLALFDMMETFLPRDNLVRSVIERDLFSKEVWNVIACEGLERVERPETYRQWQTRHAKAGFMQVPFRKELIDTVMEKMKSFHHKDFAMAENNKWLLTSWKGRVIFALSCCQPVVLP